MTWLSFAILFVLGCAVGYFTCAYLATASQADDDAELQARLAEVDAMLQASTDQRAL